MELLEGVYDETAFTTSRHMWHHLCLDDDGLLITIRFVTASYADTDALWNTVKE
jgi:hypothetical protein